MRLLLLIVALWPWSWLRAADHRARRMPISRVDLGPTINQPPVSVMPSALAAQIPIALRAGAVANADIAPILAALAELDYDAPLKPQDPSPLTRLQALLAHAARAFSDGVDPELTGGPPSLSPQKLKAENRRLRFRKRLARQNPYTLGFSLGKEKRIVSNKIGVSNQQAKRAESLGSQGTETICTIYSVAALAKIAGLDPDMGRLKEMAIPLLRDFIEAQLGRSKNAYHRYRSSHFKSRALQQIEFWESSREKLSKHDMPGFPIEGAKYLYRKLGLRVFDLDPNEKAFKIMTGTLFSGRSSSGYARVCRRIKGRIKQALAAGRAVSAAFSVSDSLGDDIGSHVVTILRLGRNSSGEEVAHAYDSAVGKIISFPWAPFLPFRAMYVEAIAH